MISRDSNQSHFLHILTLNDCGASMVTMVYDRVSAQGIIVIELISK